jgi:hypothetical protein
MPERPDAAADPDWQDAVEGGYFDSLIPGRYLRLSTFEHDGVPVSRTVHSVADGGGAYFRARSRSGAHETRDS